MKSFLFIIQKSLRYFWISNMITAVSVGLAVGLMMSVFVIQKQSYDVFTGGSFGFDAVLGARGSQLQLVLNTVFHLETSPGNISWKLYQSIKEDQRVKLAVPYALGDNYLGYRIVGTVPELFLNDVQTKEGMHLVEGGRNFNPSAKEAVIGSLVAEKTGLTVGSTFHPFHGLDYDPSMKHKDVFTVVGILKTTNSPSDRVIWIPIEGVFRMEGHVLRREGEEYIPEENRSIPDQYKEVSAVMLKLKSIQAGFHLDQTINRQGTMATLAWPVSKVMAEFFNKMGWMNKVLSLIAYISMVVAAGTILSTIYNTIHERRREFAVFRALGAKKRLVFSVIIGECAAIAAIGSVLGFIVFGVIFGLTSVILREQTGVVLEFWQFHPIFVFAPLGMILLGAVAGILPALKAYSTDVATHIVPST